MRTWMVVLAAALTASMTAAWASGAAGTATPASGEAVYAFNGTHKGNFMGSPCQVLDVTAVLSGKVMQLCVPNDPPMGGYHPSPVAEDAIKDAKPGDLFRIRTSSAYGPLVLNQIGRYETKPGETAPNAFLFVDSKEDGGNLLVDVKRFEQAAVLVVPTKKDDSGKQAPDPAIAAVVNSLKEGDVVLVTASPSGKVAIINTFEQWVAPSKGQFSKLDSVDVNGEKRPAVVLNDGSSDTTIQLPGAEKQGEWIPDPKMLAQVHKLKAGQAVEYHIGKDGDIDVLKDITVSTDAPASSK